MGTGGCIRWVLLLGAIGAAGSLILSTARDQASWLAVEAPNHAQVNTPFLVRVRLPTAPDGTRLTVGLHWTPRDGGPSRLLVKDQTVEPPPPLRDATFEFRVNARPTMAFVNIVICLSPTGRWADRTHASTSRSIPVRPASSEPVAASLAAVPMFALRPRGANEPEPSRPLRWLTAALLFAGALAGGYGRWRSSAVSGFRSSPRFPRTLQNGMILGFLAIGSWELLGLGTQLGGEGREMARGLGLYRTREPMQQAFAVLLATLAAGLGVIVIRLQVPRWIRVAFLACIVHGVLCLIGALSLHALDFLGAVPLGGASLLQVVKLANAGIGLSAVLLGLRAPPSPDNASADDADFRG